MIDSSRKQPDNRIHLFDPVGLINNSYTTHIKPPSQLRFEPEPVSVLESDASSPRLWKNEAPDSRTQAIEQGRREMMEMIKDMPESSYELSLRDMVDQKKASSDENLKEQRKVISRSGSKGKVGRSRSVDNGGFLLKTSVFPMSFWLKKTKTTKKKNKKNLGKNGSSRSGSSSNSSRSSSINTRQVQSTRFLAGCFSFKTKK